jgi:selenide,water dikinase
VHAHPDLLVGLANPDDAAVYRLNDEQAIICTLDFFPPVVDDPYQFGQIAAANALSDVYAMGGEPLLALNLAGFPEELPMEILAEIFRGGADKVAEAGAVVAGGHTVTDEEPKYGLSVVGLIHPSKVLTKSGAKPGDILVLTKPIGTGVITTALKKDLLKANAHLEAAVASMCRLNRQAARLLQEAGVTACTDITGFGLLGHGSEMAGQGKVSFELWAEAVPVLPGAEEYAWEGIAPGGLRRNRDYLLGNGLVTVDEDVRPERATLLFDPQTSGGLLAAVAPDRVTHLLEQCQKAEQPCWVIGRVIPGKGLHVSSQATIP